MPVESGKLTLNVETDIGELSRDLRSLGDDLDKPIRDVFAKGTDAIIGDAKELMRYRPEGAWKDSSGAQYDHIREYYNAKVNRLSATINSAHPAAAVWEYGGQIHPLLGDAHHMLSYRNRKYKQARMRLPGSMQRPPYTFDIPDLHPVSRAAEADEDKITRNLSDAVDRLIAEYGFDGS